MPGVYVAACPKICILNEQDARSLEFGGIAHKCSSRRHHHFSRSKVDAMVKSGELVWVGKHKRVATFRNARKWAVAPSRDGNVVVRVYQLVRG